MGRGAYYWPAKGETGPHSAWIAGGDRIDGLGMVAATNHYHFDVYFRLGGTVNVKYFKPDGSPMSESDVMTFFGPQVVGDPDLIEMWVITELHWSNGRFYAPRFLDRRGAPVPGVQVECKNDRTDAVIPATTDDEGYAVFDLSGSEHEYSVPMEAPPDHCGALSNSQVHDSVGVVRDKKMGPRVMNPVFVWNGDDDEEPIPDDCPREEIEAQLSLINEALDEVDEKLGGVDSAIEKIRRLLM